MMTNEEYETFVHMECTSKANEIKAQRWHKRAIELEEELNKVITKTEGKKK